jgi:phosphopantothenoylcysteine decarboxylase/phosphopantothenate--cysteine ligase
MSRHVVLGVSGSIAAFKAAVFASEMVKRGWEVHAVLTRGAKQFVAPLTFEAITGHPAGVEVWEEQQGSSRMGHLELARWADVLVVCPASAGTLARLAVGLADDLLGAVALASTAPLVLVPAMESSMWAHPAVQQHVATLRSRGAVVIGPVRGRLASGAEGTGRMEEPERVLEELDAILRTRNDLKGRKVLITAGPTFEPIDRVRFIGNRSSGKMGFALANEGMRRGAQVLLITGPTQLDPPPGIETVHVETAHQMRRAVLDNLTGRHVTIMAAAVADFQPRSALTGKLKRSADLILQLSPTPDIAAEASAAAPGALHVGFALEADNLRRSAREKMKRKGQHLVVANIISDDHNPFGSDENQVVIVSDRGELELPPMAKTEIARRIWDEIALLLRDKDGPEEPAAGPVDLGPGR